jgi:23S rRNA (cytidine1920-2'-O)/16S rRNA (cytidine1409-2'-O)-methyltransferase
LEFALTQFQLDPAGAGCCDLGSHVGGFVDCWLQYGALHVYAVDTCYGTLDWKLRNDGRVTVMERTNALHATLPEQVDFVSCDVGWTPQAKVIPRAWSLLKPGGRIVTLLKPQYEADPRTELIPGKGCVKPEAVDAVVARVSGFFESAGFPHRAPIETPFLGGKGKNPEFVVVLGPK